MGSYLEESGQLMSEQSQKASCKTSLKRAHLKSVIPDNREVKVIKGIVNIEDDLRTSGQTESQYINNLVSHVQLTSINDCISSFDLQLILNSFTNKKNLDTF